MRVLAAFLSFLLMASCASASTLSGYLGIGKRLGEIVSMPYNGDHFTAADGTVWKSINGNALAYTSDYSALLTDAPTLVTSATALTAPWTTGGWEAMSPSGIVGSTSGGSTWLMFMNTNGSAPDFYFTSTNAGSTWTQRTPPVASKSWIYLWDGTNFVLYSSASTTNGVQESTDGITWTSHTGISMSTFSDFIYAPSITTYLVIASGSTTAATSTDRTTWTSRTLSSTTPAGNLSNSGSFPRMGMATWNAGAGLFIVAAVSGTTYQTSPTGTTWTNRFFSERIMNFTSSNTNSQANVLFASNSTTTCAFAKGGYYGYGTDGINWTYARIDTSLNAFQHSGTNSLFGNWPRAAYYDGTRFVVVYDFGTYYSTNATSWTKATRANIPIPAVTPTNTTITGSGRIFDVPGGHGVVTDATAWMVNDVTSTNTTNIVYPITQPDSNPNNYVRIK